MLLPKRVKYRRVHRGRLTGKAKSDLVNIHTYTKDVNRLYTNFRGLVNMMKKLPEYADT